MSTQTHECVVLYFRVQTVCKRADLFMSLVVESRVCLGCACARTGLQALRTMPGGNPSDRSRDPLADWKAMVVVDIEGERRGGGEEGGGGGGGGMGGGSWHECCFTAECAVVEETDFAHSHLSKRWTCGDGILSSKVWGVGERGGEGAIFGVSSPWG